jgi:hypothetical protein
MTDQHRATPEDWDLAKSEAEDGCHTDACILELHARIEAMEARDHENANCWDMARSGMGALRERIEALEAAQLEAPMTELRAASAEARLAGLVERVRRIIGLDPVGDGKARAAIREVASWLRDERQSPMTADVLEQEADRG